jgi:hypothetical protein
MVERARAVLAAALWLLGTTWLPIGAAACDSLDVQEQDAGTPRNVAGSAADSGRPATPQVDAATATGSFSAAHPKEIELDCTNTLQCSAQMGLELPSDPIGSCKRDSGERLDASPSLQERFLLLFARCSNFVVCDYVNCVQGSR